MKEVIYLILTFGFFTSVNAQQFSFAMYFNDAIGNKDTIIIGYDTLATDSIDPSFGEVNIISMALDTSLDVRITNEWMNRNSFGIPGTFHTKRQITNYDCTYLTFNIQTIDIYTRHWPVTVTWDSSLFNDMCRNGSVFTSINPGGWWDTGSPSNLWRQELLFHDSATFTSQGGAYPGYAYINGGNDTLSVFWQAFGDSTLLFSSVPEISNDLSIRLYPNPSSHALSISVDERFGAVRYVEFYNSLGQSVYNTRLLNSIDISALPAGFYIVKIANNRGLIASGKFQKL